MRININYDGKDYSLDLEDLDMEQARVMERFGVSNLRELEQGINEGDLDALTVCYWVMLQQNGETNMQIESVRFKPFKFIKAIGEAVAKQAADEDPKEG